MTNEFVFGYTFIGFPNVFQDPSKVDRTQVGYDYKGFFKNGVSQIPVLRRQRLAGRKRRWSSTRAVSKQAAPQPGCMPISRCPASATRSPRSGALTPLKVGVFWEWIRNAQPANNNTNGNLNVNVEQLQYHWATSMPTC